MSRASADQPGGGWRPLEPLQELSFEGHVPRDDRALLTQVDDEPLWENLDAPTRPTRGEVGNASESHAYTPLAPACVARQDRADASGLKLR